MRTRSVPVVAARPDWGAPAPLERIRWLTGFEQAQAEARRTGRPLLVHFYARWCAPCRRMERDVLCSSSLVRQLNGRFIAVKLDATKHPELVERFDLEVLPGDVILSPDGRVLARWEGCLKREVFAAELSRAEQRLARLQRAAVARNALRRRTNGARREGNQPPGSNSPNSYFVRGRSDRFPLAADGLPRRKRAGSDPPLTGPVGLQGFSPVAIREQGKWVKGRPEFAARHKDIEYHLASEGELSRFLAAPDRYAPALLGCDPVVLLESGRAIPGSVNHGIIHEQRLFLFVNEPSRRRFLKAPARYTHIRHALRADQLDGTRIR